MGQGSKVLPELLKKERADRIKYVQLHGKEHFYWFMKYVLAEGLTCIVCGLQFFAISVFLHTNFLTFGYCK